MTWSILDTLDDRAALDIITSVLDDHINLPMGSAGDPATRRMLSARLKKIALAIEADKITSSTQFTMNSTTSSSDPGPRYFSLDAMKEAMGRLPEVPPLPEFVCCDFLDGCTDDDGNPAAYLIPKNFPVPTMMGPPSLGKTTDLCAASALIAETQRRNRANVVLMTPGFAEALAAEAAKHSIKISIKGYHEPNQEG